MYVFQRKLPMNPGSFFLSTLFALAGSGLAHSQAPVVEAVVGAVAGSPFGVGRVILPVDEGFDAELFNTHLMTVDNRDGRVLYPAIRYTRPLGLLMDALGVESPIEAPNQLHIHFLFSGTEPFDLQLSLPQARTLRVVPNRRRIAYQRLLRAWWVRYKSTTRQKMARRRLSTRGRNFF